MSKDKKNKKKRSKTQESPQQQYVPPQRSQQEPTEADPEQENETEEMQESVLKEEVGNQVAEKPWDEYDDVIAFIYNWGFAFILCVFTSFFIISVTIDGLLTFHYNETLRVSLSVLWLLFFATNESARLALNKHSEFLTYIFKWAGITSYFVVAILSAILCLRNDLSIMDINNEFWKIAPWICILWMISIISTGITWFMTYDRQNMKMVVLDFSSFILKHAAVFYLLLGILSITIFYNGSLLAIYFDETFGKLLISFCYILIVGVVSGCIALFTESFKWIEYKTGVTWKMFKIKILARSQTEFPVE